MIPRILVIAGSDSGGGAGIQADIKTITMLGGHAMTAVTAITAQNTLGVQAVHPVPIEIVIAQITSVISDIGVDAVKIGMLGSAATARAVAEALQAVNVPIVFDPVMVATSGAALADAETIAAFTDLMRLAAIVTPNLPELAALGSEAAVLALAPALLVKGGHGEGAEIVDRLVTREGEAARWEAPRIDTRHTHGTGCTLASAITVGLARGLPLTKAVETARIFVRLALQDAPSLGRGCGPLGHGRVRLDLGPGSRLNQITLPLADYAAACAFYTQLGLRQIVGAADGHYARFETAGGATLSVEAGAEPAVYLEQENLDGTVASLQGAGVMFECVPADTSWLWREAWVRDPAGNRICLFEAGEHRRYPPWRLR